MVELIKVPKIEQEEGNADSHGEEKADVHEEKTENVKRRKRVSDPLRKKACVDCTKRCIRVHGMASSSSEKARPIPTLPSFFKIMVGYFSENMTHMDFAGGFDCICTTVLCHLAMGGRTLCSITTSASASSDEQRYDLDPRQHGMPVHVCIDSGSELRCSESSVKELDAAADESHAVVQVPDGSFELGGRFSTAVRWNGHVRRGGPAFGEDE